MTVALRTVLCIQLGTQSMLVMRDEWMTLSSAGASEALRNCYTFLINHPNLWPLRVECFWQWFLWVSSNRSLQVFWCCLGSTWNQHENKVQTLHCFLLTPTLWVTLLSFHFLGLIFQCPLMASHRPFCMHSNTSGSQILQQRGLL